MIQAAAESYLDNGFSVLPCNKEQKRPTLMAWKKYQATMPTEYDIQSWFQRGEEDSAICVVCGAVSGNLECIDFDSQGEMYEPWCDEVGKIAPGLLDKLVFETSPSGGYHAFYRSDSSVGGCQKLTNKVFKFKSPEAVFLFGKEYIPVATNGEYHVNVNMIETRGEGGIVLCAPTPGYRLIQGTIEGINQISHRERDVLLNAARGLSDIPSVGKVEATPTPLPPVGSVSQDRVGDLYNQSGRALSLLVDSGWVKLHTQGKNLMLRRPGKKDGQSASWDGEHFYCFSSNAHPFEPSTAYSGFGVYAMLECQGDYIAATKRLSLDYPKPEGDVEGVDLSGLYAKKTPELPVLVTPPPQLKLTKAPTIPVEWLRLPGFCSEVMDISLAGAVYPNQVMAFCGAIALQSTLCGRKVKDYTGVRPNLYLICLGMSGCGKDYPRKVNVDILRRSAQLNMYGEKIASAEGLQDKLKTEACMLYQTDEIAGFIKSFGFRGDPRYQRLMEELMQLYSASDSVYMPRQKAGGDDGDFVSEPHLTLLGTSVPSAFYEAMSEAMLYNGFFSRCLIFESGKRCRAQDPAPMAVNDRILAIAAQWKEYAPGGNMADVNPVAAVVEMGAIEKAVISEFSEYADDKYSQAESEGCNASTSLWARAVEQTKKLALIYACSERYDLPRFSVEGLQWAWRLVVRNIEVMLWKAEAYVSDSEDHRQMLRIKEILKTGSKARSTLLRRTKMTAKVLDELLTTLVDSGEVVVDVSTTTSRFYLGGFVDE